MSQSVGQKVLGEGLAEGSKSASGRTNTVVVVDGVFGHYERD